MILRLFIAATAIACVGCTVSKMQNWPAVGPLWSALHTTVSAAEPETLAHSSASYRLGAVLGSRSKILRAEAEFQPAKLFVHEELLAERTNDLSRRAGSVSGAGAEDRAYTVEVLTRIAEPVLDALSNNKLKEHLPLHSWEAHRSAWTHYEAFARTLAGIAPWLELGPDDTPEGRLRAQYIRLARRSLINATDPASIDYMNFGQVPDQPLVESAYLASALLAAPNQLWEPLTPGQRAKVAAALRMTRKIPFHHNNNWLLFPAMAEAALWKFTGDFRLGPIERAVRTFEQKWYLGDGVYGDGPQFRWDYYNSYVIHPMLLQVLLVAQEMNHPIAQQSLPIARQRAHRYAEVLERLISPEGTLPIMGRSSAYRSAALYHLAYMALKRDLPEGLEAGAVRDGITTVIRRMFEAPGTVDEEGWLHLGAVGHQPGLREAYNATGSLYVALTGLVHLGLPPDDPFWTTSDASWTQKSIWAGEDVPRDEGLKDGRLAPTWRKLLSKLWRHLRRALSSE